MIPSPNLDDRTFEDLVEEAKRLIPQYCPEWTNFNPSDPGITLIELFAWMTEMMLYRLNKVPEKNYLAFLELMGVRLRPPQPARALLQMKVSEAVDHLHIARGTPFGTRSTANDRGLTFETDDDVTLVNNRLKRVVCQFHDAATQRILINDVSESALEGNANGFDPFSGVREVSRYLYLGDSRLTNFNESAMLTLFFRRSDASRELEGQFREFPRLLEWEVWNGERWKELGESAVETTVDSIAFYGPPAVGPTEVSSIKNHWLRARLVEVPRSALETEIDTIYAQLEITGEGMLPDAAIVQEPGSGLFLSCDLDRNFLPFHKKPDIDSTFYMACATVLSRPDTEVRITVQMSDATVAPAPAPSEELTLRWQYWNGKKWSDIARSTPEGVDEKNRRFSFEDDTRAFTRGGTIRFIRPPDMAQCEVDQIANFWIRARIEKGNYGVEGSYINIDDRWVYEKGSLAPPSLSGIVFTSSEEARPFEHVLSFNDWSYQELTAEARLESKPFQPFAPIPDENPSLYLGFAEPFPNLTAQVYFRTSDEGSGFALPSPREREAILAEASVQGASGTGRNERAAEPAGQSVIWEYWDGKIWHPLLPRDYTANFTSSGFLQFVGPKDFRATRRFGEELYWMRARLEMGGYDVPPKIQRVLLNCTYASNITTYSNAVLGTSQGTPNQFYRFVRGPVLAGQVIAIREPEVPQGPELEAVIADLGEQAIIVEPPDSNSPGGCLVVWKEVESLYESGPKSRHYVKDIVRGEIRFGDGVHGMIPQKGERNVVALRYQVGGGEAGNVAGDSITVMKHSIGYLEAVTNPYSASGGCDLETVDEVKLRGPHMLKTRNRAVTAEDFEWLAIEASNSVARVKALASLRQQGEVVVVVVPRVPKGIDGRIDLNDKPIPSQELLGRVRRFLDERKLLTTVVRVVRPSYVELSVEVRIVRSPSGSPDRIKREIESSLRRFLHPLAGGRNGKGWPFGRSVYKADLYHVVEEVSGVDFVDAIRIIDADHRREVDQLRLQAHELVFLTHVDISEIAQERIV